MPAKFLPYCQLILLVFSLFIVKSGFAQIESSKEIAIVPEPVSMILEEETFSLDYNTTIVYRDDRAHGVSLMLADELKQITGYSFPISKKKSKNTKKAIRLILNASKDDEIGLEGYRLNIHSDNISIIANEPNGLFYGVQTFSQLLPVRILNSRISDNSNWEVPCLEIMDYPRFGYRGLMLDVSRHFFSKDFIKRYIDRMSKYKFNVFHWHLTDNTGWRIEIKGLPKLTEVGAWRVPRIGPYGTFDPAHVGEEATDGGFYTQEDIKEIIAFARERFVTIIPEIDVPGHSRALLASYPNVSCGQVQYAVDPGSIYHTRDVNELCPARDSTWLILEKIFTEVADLFPDSYIHIGGDEVQTKSWEHHDMDLQLMHEKGYATFTELQGYFEEGMNDIILSLDRQPVLWYDTNQVELRTSEPVAMIWKDANDAIKAVENGYKVVMAPNAYSYLDYKEGSLSLQKVYNFEPAIEGIKEEDILGGQGCLWTEKVPNERQAEFMTWPRAMALSEVYWSPKEKKDWDGFAKRVEYQFDRMDYERVKYALFTFEPTVTVLKRNIHRQIDNDMTTLKLDCAMPNVELFYRFDETEPDEFSPKYKGEPLIIPKGAKNLKVVSYFKGRPVARKVFPIHY